MRIIASTPEENELLADIAKCLEAKGVSSSTTRYEDGFGVTVWSVDDLDEVPAARNWPVEKRQHFMEKYGEKIGGATDEAWMRIAGYVEEYRKNEDATNSPTAQAINGEIRHGDYVIAVDNNDYAYLVGEVIEIVKHGTPEHAAETDNDTDSVHVNFKAISYPINQHDFIADYFNALNDTGETMLYDDLPLDDVIMGPDMLVRITELGVDKIKELVSDYDEATSYCDSFTGNNE